MVHALFIYPTSLYVATMAMYSKLSQSNAFVKSKKRRDISASIVRKRELELNKKSLTTEGGSKCMNIKVHSQRISII